MAYAEKYARWLAKPGNLEKKRAAARERIRRILADPEKKSAFYARQRKSRVKNNYRSQHQYRLKTDFGLTLAQYESMLAAQNGVCAICGSLPGKRRLSVDHDHKTGVVRGLLCDGCNLGLGNFRDNHDALINAIGYLARYANG